MKEKQYPWLERLGAANYWDRNKEHRAEVGSVEEAQFTFGCVHFEMSLL